MIKISPEQEGLVKKITSSYLLNGEGLLNNDGLKLTFIKDSKQLTEKVKIKIMDFFINGDFIGIEDNLKSGSYRNIEFKLRDELNRTVFVDGSENNAFLLNGRIKDLQGYFVMIAEKEWSLNYNSRIDAMAKKYPQAHKDNYSMHGNSLNTSQFWQSYLKNANPLFINPYSQKIFRFNDLLEDVDTFGEPSTNFDRFPFIEHITINADLMLNGDKNWQRGDFVPVYYNIKADRVMCIGIGGYSVKPVIAFFGSKDQRIFYIDQGIELMLKYSGDMPLSNDGINTFTILNDGKKPEIKKEKDKFDSTEKDLIKLWMNLTEEYRKSLKN